ncbi:hypothetical protein HZB60_00840 [candidate division KSB1 bacterium]|nr:hypothetical protein [candidate division KSB1 bacterium]
MFSKTNLIYLGMFLAGFAVINTGVYFLLHSTQPKSAILLTEGGHADGADSLKHEAPPPAGEMPDLEAESMHSGELADAGKPAASPPSPERHLAAVEPSQHSTAKTPVPVAPTETKQAEPSVAETMTDLQSTETVEPEIEDTSGASQALVEDQQKLAKLAKLLESMKPDEAAAIASELSTDVIVQLVLRMKDRNAAKMMAALPVDLASQVADLMSQVATRSKAGE